MNTHILSSNQDYITHSLSVLRRGGIIAFPTDTIYALACDATNKEAIDKIYHLKQRNPSKPLSIFLPNIQWATKLVEWNDMADLLFDQFMPGAITMILPLKDSHNLGFKRNDIGIRFPNHPIANAILKAFDFPLIATSVNVSGEGKEAHSIDTIDPSLLTQIDLVIDGGPTDSIASTVVNLVTSPPTILREGSISVETLRPFLRNTQ